MPYPRTSTMYSQIQGQKSGQIEPALCIASWARPLYCTCTTNCGVLSLSDQGLFRAFPRRPIMHCNVTVMASGFSQTRSRIVPLMLKIHTNYLPEMGDGPQPPRLVRPPQDAQTAYATTCGLVDHSPIGPAKSAASSPYHFTAPTYQRREQPLPESRVKLQTEMIQRAQW